MKKSEQKTLVIIAGVAGEIGTSFARRITKKETDVIGVIRKTPVSEKMNSHFSTVSCDLSNEYQIEDAFKNIALENYSNVIYLHTIGVDKFNPRNYPEVVKMNTIDPDIYDTNVNSFKYLLRYLGKKVAEINTNGTSLKLKTAIISGTSDKYAPFVIEDFCEAKYIIREYIRSYVGRFPEWFSGLAINVTLTITKSALAVRPYAKTDYWLTDVDVVEQSISDLLSQDLGYKEIDLMKHSPNYVEGYYEDKDMLYTKWSAETGIVSPNMMQK